MSTLPSFTLHSLYNFWVRPRVPLLNFKLPAGYRAIVLFVGLLSMVGCIATQPNGGSTQTPTVSITPTNPSVTGGAEVVFTATSNAPSPAVTWYLGGLSGTQCGPAMTPLGLLTCGPASNQATLLAPATAPSPNAIQIVAELSATNTVSNTATVTVTPSIVAISLLPTTTSVAPGATVSFAASVTGTSYDEVGWEVNGVPNGNATYGAITFVPASLEYSPNVTYTAPATIPSGVTSVTITAAAVANPVDTAMATVTFSSGTSAPGISLSPATATVNAGGQQQFTANVSGVTNPTVAWLVEGGPNYGTISVGSPSTTATYTAPASAPAGGGTVTITAQVQGTSATGSSAVTIMPAVVGITLLPATVTVGSGSTQLFTAAVTGTTDQAVNWVVVGGANNGTIVSSPPNSLTATYTAPTLPAGANSQTITVTAQSQADTSKQASAAVTVTPPSTLTVSPAGVSIPVGGTQPFTASQSGVTWSVAAASGCTAANVGSINSSGLYTAPPVSAILPASPCPIEVTAAPSSGPSGSALANLRVAVAITNLASSPATIGVGANWLYTASVGGASVANQGVIWSSSTNNPGSCTNPGGLFPSLVSPYTDPNGGFYYAPVCLPSSPMTITATSAFDPIQSQSTTVTVQQPDPVGSATLTSTTTNCPAGIGGTTGASCYTLDVACPGVADWPNTYLKVNQPTGTPVGTVILGTGSGGNYVYDNDTPDFFYTDTQGDTVNGGLAVVQGILDDGFTTVQVAFSPLDNPTQFSNGWLTGPGGVRRLACRYATVAQWVYANIQKSNVSVPMCATGNSGGAAAIAYALTIYGESNLFAMVETTSGPPMTRLDWACSSQSMTADFTCNSLPTQNLPFNFSLSEAEIIDPAYPSGEPFCSNAVNGTGTQAPTDLFLSDSILGGPQPTPTVDPPTYVNIVLGGADTTAAVQQGQHWGPAVGATNKVCVSDAPHALPAAPSGDGVTQIVTDIQNLCKLP
jgi:hypothetical protein